MKCSNCGSENPAGATECARCKAPLERAQSAGARGRSNSAVMLGMGLLLAAGAAAALMRSGGSGEGTSVFVRADAPEATEVAAPEPTEPEGPASSVAFVPDRTPPGATTAADPAQGVAVEERPRDEITRVVRQNANQTRACFERGLQKNPKLAGRVDVSFTISPEGRVVVASASKSTVPDLDVTACVVRVFRGLSFSPSSGGPVTVEYPVVFQAQ